MWVVVVAVVLIVVATAVVAVLRRPRGADLSSVRKYHSALGTIEHLSERTGPSSIRVGDQPGPGHDVGPGGALGGGPGAGGAPGSMAGGRSVPPVPVRGNDEFPDPGDPLVFDDSRPRDRYQRESSRPSGGPARTDRAQRQALESMNRRPRRGTAIAAVVIVVALIGALAFVGRGRSKPTAHSHTGATSSVSATTPTTAAAGTSATTGSSGSGHRGSSHNSSHKRHAGKSTTPTTVPPAQVVAVTSTAASATYPVATTSYQVTVHTSAPCWVLATSAATGSTLWTGTLQAGASQVIAATGVATVELGAPSATLALDNVPVVFPNPAHTPFVATFQPTAAATGGTTSSTTPSTTPATSSAGGTGGTGTASAGSSTPTTATGG